MTWPDGNARARRAPRDGRRRSSAARGASISTRRAARDHRASDHSGPFGIEADARDRRDAELRRQPHRRAARRGQPHGDYGAWAVANVHLRARPVERGRGAPPAWDNVFRDSPSLGYVCATHQRGRDRGPTVWTWYYPFTDEDPRAVRKKLAGAGYAEWAETSLADLERAHPDVRDHVERIEVAFWGHGMIRPRVGARSTETFPPLGLHAQLQLRANVPGARHPDSAWITMVGRVADIDYEPSFSVCGSLMYAESTGEVRLRSTDPFARARIDFRYFSNPAGSGRSAHHHAHDPSDRRASGVRRAAHHGTWNRPLDIVNSDAALDAWTMHR